MIALGCAGREGLPPPATPLAATPADAIPEPVVDAPDAPIRLDVREVTLDNGVRVIVAPRPAEGLATVVLLDRAAAGHDRRASRAVTELLAFAMSDATRVGDQVVPSYARREGFDLSLGLQARALVAAATFSAERVPDFLQVLDRTVRQPVFRDRRIARLLERRLETVEGELATAEGILDDRLPSLLYAREDRRSAPLSRRRAELRRVTPDALRARHAEILDPASSTLVVAGEVDPGAVLAAARATFGRWEPNPSAPDVAPNRYSDAPVRGVGLVRPLLRPWIGLLERAPPLDHADHPAFLVLAQVLGGMFSARLNVLIRENQTVSYGLGASYDADPGAGELRVVTAVDPRQVAPFVATLLEELERVRGARGGLTEQELAVARTRARQTLRARLDTTAGLASTLAEHALADLPPSRIHETLDAVDALDAGAIEAAARRWIRPDRAPLGVVAARDIFERQLARVPLGRFEVIVPPPRVRR